VRLAEVVRHRSDELLSHDRAPLGPHVRMPKGWATRGYRLTKMRYSLGRSSVPSTAARSLRPETPSFA
jgi:hypothetical protein